MILKWVCMMLQHLLQLILTQARCNWTRCRFWLKCQPKVKERRLLGNFTRSKPQESISKSDKNFKWVKNSTKLCSGRLGRQISKLSYPWLCTKARWLQKYNIPKIDQNRGLLQLPKLRWGKLQELHTCWQRRTERPNARRRRCQCKPQKSHSRDDMFLLLLHFLIIFAGGSPRLLFQGQCKTTCSTKIKLLSRQAILSKKNGETRYKQYLWSKTLWLKAKAKCQRFHLHWKRNLL